MIETEGDAEIPFARRAEPDPLALALVGTPATERAGEGVHINLGVDVRGRPCPQSLYPTDGAAHLNNDPEPDPELDANPDPDPGAKGAPSGSSNTHGVACAKAGRDQRGGRSWPDAPAEERECERADMEEWDKATRSTLGTCPPACSRRCWGSWPFPFPWPFPCPCPMVCRRMRASAG